LSPRKLRTVLKALRKERGFSQRELAKEGGVTGAYLAQLETGKKTNPSLESSGASRRPSACR
jgi:transcriptional regulator with XRE-family HTH domain